jgi:hypothetical protein
VRDSKVSIQFGSFVLSVLFSVLEFSCASAVPPRARGLFVVFLDCLEFDSRLIEPTDGFGSAQPLQLLGLHPERSRLQSRMEPIESPERFLTVVSSWPEGPRSDLLNR